MHGLLPLVRRLGIDVCLVLHGVCFLSFRDAEMWVSIRRCISDWGMGQTVPVTKGGKDEEQEASEDEEEEVDGKKAGAELPSRSAFNATFSRTITRGSVSTPSLHPKEKLRTTGPLLFILRKTAQETVFEPAACDKSIKQFQTRVTASRVFYRGDKGQISGRQMTHTHTESQTGVMVSRVRSLRKEGRQLFE